MGDAQHVRRSEVGVQTLQTAWPAELKSSGRGSDIR